MTQKNRQAQLFQGDVEFADDSAVSFGSGAVSLGSGDLTLASGDLTVTAGNVDVVAGTLDVGGALTVDSGGATVTAGNVDVVAGTLDVGGALTVDSGGATITAGDLTMTAGDIVLGANTLTRTGRDSWVPAAVGKIGATAGFVTAADGGLVTVPASQTASTFVIPITGLHLGDTLQAVNVVAQVESAGNIATVAISVRKQTLAAADFTDSELAAAASGNLTADTAISPANTALGVATLAEVLAEGEQLYALITVTTAAATDVALAGLIVNYDQA